MRIVCNRLRFIRMHFKRKLLIRLNHGCFSKSSFFLIKFTESYLNKNIAFIQASIARHVNNSFCCFQQSNIEMRGNRIRVKRTGVDHRAGLSLPQTNKNSISHQSSLSIPRVTRVSLSRRHRSLQIQVRGFFSSIKFLFNILI